MGLSETILAAMIGAAATMTTALFQIFTAFKNRGKVDLKPRRGTTLRSIIAVLALMVASAAGGFLYSELLKQRNSEDLVAMRQELRELKELTAFSMRKPDEPIVAEEPMRVSLSASDAGTGDAGGSAESMVYVPACRRAPDPGTVGTVCGEADAQRVALCGSIPSYARAHRIELFAQRDAVQHPWEQHRVGLEADLGGARFTGRSFEYAQGEELKAVCTSFLQWSSEHPHIARIVVHYGFGEMSEEPTAPVAESVTATVPTVMAAEPPAVAPQTASFVQ
jgi:hypothetical protein